jgi:hypothetical protein
VESKFGVVAQQGISPVNVGDPDRIASQKPVPASNAKRA